MKKFIENAALAAVMVLSLSSFVSLEQEMKNCDSYANKSVRAESEAYGFGSYAELESAFNWYYNACVSSGGNIQDPVFIP